ncbi:GEVED domain-containing protein [Flavobacterium lacisediminis]|uniref:GEVED domain-containing protein n=1 Tax=Flavobacterium lacisediminis TaxID=2989705 RepID=A0ABT3EFM8_9FLAO|nr:GEVED domain-containing protein [Flavobacterium lacisediminis]MCW1147378.1 GEVED domain-containing protein [Flavobacterium lacisediminis]
MKTLSPYWKNFLVFLFFVFTTTSFAQGTSCASAESLTINGTCDAASITDSTQDTPTATGCSIGTFRREGWYTFTVPAGPNLSITITANASNRDLFLQLISSTSSCSGLAQINCANTNTTAGAQTETITTTLSPGIYYIKVINNGNNNDMNLTSICITTPCTGTPNAGTTSVSPTSGVAGSSYTVSNTGYSTGIGYTYQWQYSTNGGGTWTNQGTATSTYSNYTATAPASGTVIWQLVVTCTNSSQSATSTSDTFTTTAAYCIPTNTYSTSYYISGVTTTGGIANISNTPTGFSAYTNYSAQFVSQIAGSSFSITATHPSSTYGYNVWVDWNNDADFNDAGENVISTGYLSTPANLGSITIPLAQPAGSYRMRIRNAYLSNPAPACGDFDYGEAEDYTIQVVLPPACSGTPTAGTTSVSPVSGNPGSSYTVSATGYTLATGLTFQWQYSTNGGSTWTNQGAATGTYSNYTATAPVLGTTVLWQLIVTCTSNGQSATSNSASFTSVSTQNIPTTGNNSVTCGTNILLYDNGGSTGDYASSSTGYTVLDAGLGATINISGNYVTESGLDYIRIYDGTGTGGTLLASYSGTGSINYTGTVGQTLTVQFYSDGSVTYSGFSLSVTYSGVCFPACSGTPSAGTVSVSPNNGGPGSTYTVAATGMTLATGMTYQWQSNTNGAGWVNVGASTSSYSNYSATAPVTVGTTVAWQLVVTCTNSSQSATSTNSTFTVVSILNIPTSGNNTVTCGTNITLYDNGGSTGNYANNSSGYTILEAGLGAIINISGNYTTESSIDYIRIYSGIGTGGTLLASYSGTGTINYTGTAGQTLTVQFYSDSSVTYSGFSLSVSYSGVCFPACAGLPVGGTVITNPNTGWPGSPYVVSATGYTQALNLTYQWQYSTDAGATWTNAGAATSSYVNYNATAPASGLVHWQLVVTCTNSGLSANSNTAIFTTMTVSDVATGCPNVVSGGLGLNGLDPAAINCTAASTCVDLEATYLDLGETTNYIVEPIAYNPPFAFNGLANPVSVNTDDVYSPLINLPFDFCFYGNTYNQCTIGSNGILSFNTSLAGTSSGYSFSNNIPISGDARLKENSIFGVFHDIDPGVGGEVGWQLITLPTGCRALVASWYNVPMFSDNSILYTGMMVLYENSNVIEIYIKEKNIDNNNVSPWNGGNAVVGIQNATGTLASVPPARNGLDTNWTTTNEAWRFVPSGNSIASIKWYEGAGTTGPVVGTTPTLSVCPTSTTVYTAEITYTLCDGRTIKEVDQTTVTINGSKVWNGSVSTNWNVANNWTPSGVPTALDCVVIPDTANDPIISGTNFNGLGLNLTINNNANLTVTTNNDLTITNWVNIYSTGDLILQNSASLIQTNNDVNQGTMHMTRTANIRKLDYVYWSSPVTSFASSAISPGTPTWAIYKWNPTIPTNTNGFGNWVSGNETMALGKGYIVRGPDSFTSTVAPFNAVFAGTPNNGTITTPIFRGTWNGGTYSTGVSTTLGTNDDDNWNLIGNPYPSSVRAIDFLTLNTNIDGFIKVWTHGTLPSSAIADPFYNNYVYNYTPGDYITYNSSGTSSGPGVFNGNIAAGQGFFVLMRHTSASAAENVTFNNSMRSSTYDNSQFFRTSNENGRIWLDLIASNGSNIRNLVAYADGATNDRDRLFDAITDEKLNLNLYSLIGEKPMTIQGRTLPFDQEDRVPMGIKVPQSGNYTIGIGTVDGFFSDASQDIYLEDLQNNIIHDLRQSPYNFTSTEGNFPNRFVLRYTNETLGNDDIITDDANLWVISSEVLSVKSTKNEIKSVRVFDVLGRHLAYYPNVNGYEVPLNTIQKNNAGLIIQVTLSNGTVISKKAIY